jgi:hypothetical protein
MKGLTEDAGEGDSSMVLGVVIKGIKPGTKKAVGKVILRRGNKDTMHGTVLDKF